MTSSVLIVPSGKGHFLIGENQDLNLYPPFPVCMCKKIWSIDLQIIKACTFLTLGVLCDLFLMHLPTWLWEREKVLLVELLFSSPLNILLLSLSCVYTKNVHFNKGEVSFPYWKKNKSPQLYPQNLKQEDVLRRVKRNQTWSPELLHWVPWSPRIFGHEPKENSCNSIFSCKEKYCFISERFDLATGHQLQQMKKI